MDPPRRDPRGDPRPARPPPLTCAPRTCRRSTAAAPKAPKPCADAEAVTTISTGAIIGAATDVLARPGPSVLALLGASGQAPDQIRAVHAVRPLTALAVFDLDRARR
ncbi:hypothetical protein [Saccharopolyspora spinosa]|uniref:Orf7 n=1 Tax=Saccharopolyspora spinosa TaxID=60894 RepID=Q6JHR0_SACSN|nr:hypothetical protein [Saccharopolyspora spinosa]AAS00397.1 Orf7 [Saccharopolyspora spinosa NRRL 18395]